MKSEIIVCEPSSIKEVNSLVDFIRSNHAVIVNFKSADDQNQQRIVDVLFGACFALRGNLKQLNDNVIVCLPNCVQLEDILTEDISEQE